MKMILSAQVSEAKDAALEVLLHNLHGTYRNLPRTAGWGYPEPYTRDLMISSLGMLASGHDALIAAVRRTLLALAETQTPLGHIASLAHDANDLGASDTTPLFLMALAIYRKISGEYDFLLDAAGRALAWMQYQSPGDEVIVGQLPTSDWRDEQWVLGFGLYVNTVVYTYLRLFGFHARAETLRKVMRNFDVVEGEGQRHVHHGLAIPHKPYYALWAYKAFRSERFDLLGNSLAIISGLASPSRAQAIIHWVEGESVAMRERLELAGNLPPNFFPFIQRSDPDWQPRYEEFNQPGEYHNGGVWPFIAAFYVVATLAAGFPALAEEKLAALTDLVRLARDPALPFGFNEWIRAQDGTPQGQDWQTWSAAMFLYAATCVEQGRVLYFEGCREER